MPAILQPAEFQALDADGKPYAGGSLATYVPGTSTPKATWVDEGLTALNTNPIILDAAGRCIIWGDGLYRTILRDAAGNLIWDQLSTTVVSAAMEDFALSPTLADALLRLGVQDAIDTAVAVETNRATAAEAALGGRIDAETTARINADNALGARIDAETAARIAADNAINARIDGIDTAVVTGIVQVRYGTAMTDGDGNIFIPFDPPFPTGVIDTVGGNPWILPPYTYTTPWTITTSGMSGSVLNDNPEGEPDTPAAFVSGDWYQMGY